MCITILNKKNGLTFSEEINSIKEKDEHELFQNNINYASKDFVHNTYNNVELK